MAWPCITRACCINRFWSELDKADIAVPLVFSRYSDVAGDAHHHLGPQPLSRQKRSGGVAIETHQPQHPPGGGEQEAKAPPGGDGGDGPGGGSVTRQDFQAWKGRPAPICKPRNEYQKSTAPFDNETQYQKDYKPWPIPKKGDHPWIPKQQPGTGAATTAAGTKLEHAAAEAESGVEKSEIEEKVHEKESSKDSAKKPVKSQTEKPLEKKSAAGKTEEQLPAAADVSAERKGRAAADALNRQIKEVVSTGTSYRNEFKAYKDVKPVKPIKAPSQYKPPVPVVDGTNLETSYSATFKGEQVKGHAADNKQLERRRIRSLYNEPGKDSPKTDKPVSRAKPKKTPTTTTGKMVKKAKEKQIASSLSAKKKPPSTAEPKPDSVVTKKSKEISNRLAEAKQ